MIGITIYIGFFTGEYEDAYVSILTDVCYAFNFSSMSIILKTIIYSNFWSFQIQMFLKFLLPVN